MEDLNLKQKVEETLAKIRPALQADGGDVELVDVIEGTVKVKLTGSCGSCPFSKMTLKQGIEGVLRARFPEIKEVISV